jgi:hypothetical protein
MVCTTRRWRELDSNSQSQALCLHHFYRAMAWLGETVEEASEASSAPRCVEDVIEERLFARRRDLFTDLSVVFMDPTSLSFEGDGGPM